MPIGEKCDHRKDKSRPKWFNKRDLSLRVKEDKDQVDAEAEEP